jgi:hypothetical protein
MTFGFQHETAVTSRISPPKTAQVPPPSYVDAEDNY